MRRDVSTESKQGDVWFGRANKRNLVNEVAQVSRIGMS